jgi:hypothetical protein
MFKETYRITHRSTKNMTPENLIVHYIKIVAKILRIPKIKIDMDEQNGNRALGIQITGNDSI